MWTFDQVREALSAEWVYSRVSYAFKTSSRLRYISGLHRFRFVATLEHFSLSTQNFVSSDISTRIYRKCYPRMAKGVVHTRTLATSEIVVMRLCILFLLLRILLSRTTYSTDWRCLHVTLFNFCTVFVGLFYIYFCYYCSPFISCVRFDNKTTISCRCTVSVTSSLL